MHFNIELLSFKSAPQCFAFIIKDSINNIMKEISIY
jgi:hypothetical protein